MPVLVGFGHRARQGKNTAALAMLNACPLESQVRLYAFADALRAEVRKACYTLGGQSDLISSFKEAGLMPDWVHVEDPKPRSLLQWWGTEYRRAKDPDYWVKRLRKTLEDHKPDFALITDVRFPNEAEFIKQAGGLLVKVIRLGAPDITVHPHASESELDGYTGWDHVIEAVSAEDCKRQAEAIWML